MRTIKCRKCGKVYPFDEKICPVCGYDIRKDETLSPRDRAALGLKSDSALFDETNKENMERWKNQTKEERLEEAQAVIEEGLKENPYQVDFYHFASENSYRLHDSKKAEQYLIDALKTGEKEDETLLILSNLYLSEELYEEAIEAVEAMENTDQPYALWNLAQAYYQLEEFEQAAKFYAEASFSLQDEADFLKEYGLFLREEGRLREASEYLVNYLNLEPGDLEVLSILEDLQER